MRRKKTIPSSFLPLGRPGEGQQQRGHLDGGLLQQEVEGRRRQQEEEGKVEQRAEREYFG